MAANTLAAVLPLQLVCQLVVLGAENSTQNTTVNVELTAAVNQLPLPKELPKLPEGYVAYPDIGAAYKIHNENVTWTAARKLCIRRGSQLAFIDTPEKTEHVETEGYFHVGIHKFDGSWVSSSDGSPVSGSIPWGTGEPETHSCVAIGVQSTSKEKKLHALPCFAELRYVCEIPIPRQ